MAAHPVLIRAGGVWQGLARELAPASRRAPLPIRDGVL